MARFLFVTCDWIRRFAVDSVGWSKLMISDFNSCIYVRSLRHVFQIRNVHGFARTNVPVDERYPPVP